jgi:hypothetical protein
MLGDVSTACIRKLVVLFFESLALSSLAYASEQPHALPFRWPMTLTDIPDANKTPIAVIEGLVNSGPNPDGLPRSDVQEFRFARLERDKIDLVAVIDSGPRRQFFYLAVISKLGMGFRRALLPSAPPHLLATEILDLDGNGISRIVAKNLVAGYRGSETDPVFWYTIYGILDGMAKDVSAQYPRFYQTNVLPKSTWLERILASPEQSNKRRIEEMSAEVAFVPLKYEQLIAHKPDQARSTALEWSVSPDARIQLLAIELLKNDDTARSLSALGRLSHSSDFEVSQAAQSVLAAKSR